MRDAQRLTQWAADHSAAVYGFLLGAVGDRAAAEDLLQEVFYRAWSSRKSYRERGQARAYLLRIAQRLALDHLRRRRREKLWIAPVSLQIEPDANEPTAEMELERRENEQRLLAALETLSGAQRQALLLRYYGELSFEEIARAMNSPLGTALSHCRRGLLALRRLLVAES